MQSEELKQFEKYAKSQIELGCFRILIQDYQFVDAIDEDDKNWLNILAVCQTEQSMVIAQGNIIQTFDLKRFLDQIVRVYNELDGSAELSPIEPNLFLRIKINKNGQIEMVLNLTPDHLNQKHEFVFQIDQSYLPRTISDLKMALNAFPLR